MNAYESLVRPLLFRMDAERAHAMTIDACRAVGAVPLARRVVRRRYAAGDSGLAVRALGRDLPNPLGLAAGFDKNGHAAPLLRVMGFGHVEIGSVSTRPSPGNPRPRLFRLVEDEGIAVWYGVPNEGAERVAATLRRGPAEGAALGVNLVRTNTPEAHAGDADAVCEDYRTSFARLQPVADYVALNLSCPNTEGQEFFDEPSHLDLVLHGIAATEPRVPVVLKLRPTLDTGLLTETVRVCDGYDFVAGFAINLPAGRPPQLRLSDAARVAALPGAISGRPVRCYIDEVLGRLSKIIGSGSRYTLVAAGGITTAGDAYAKIRAGATLVQLYTALIFHGPRVVREVLTGLADLLERDGFGSVREAVGADVW
jgi:dihydroorotate dehydrogenase (fumarate)/dihydroorotate dehydrogenase